MAQLVARLVRIEEVRGSNPLRSTEGVFAYLGIFIPVSQNARSIEESHRIPGGFLRSDSNFTLGDNVRRRVDIITSNGDGQMTG